MKIAIFFLLVGLSSCFVPAVSISGNASGGLMYCRGKITLPQGEILATMAAMLIHRYEQMKATGMQNSLEKICLLDMAFSIVRLVSSFKECDMNIIIQEVLNCLDLDVQSKRIIGEAFLRNRPELALTINADMSVLIRAVCCTADKLISDDGLNLGKILTKILPNLVGLLGPLLGPVTEHLGSALNVAFRVVNIAGKFVFSVGNVLNGVTSSILGGSGIGPLGGLLGGGLNRVLSDGLLSGILGGASNSILEGGLGTILGVGGSLGGGLAEKRVGGGLGGSGALDIVFGGGPVDGIANRIVGGGLGSGSEVLGTGSGDDSVGGLANIGATVSGGFSGGELAGGDSGGRRAITTAGGGLGGDTLLRGLSG
ncbi:isoniazid-induced protein IniB-like [Dendropsophus ebraccatus]|uniref:isoniazid-induced protein IniB-like n=1 Tax=Dendropsophus ebraccatus TaxID=150705 RepID=UPI0038316EDB